MKIYDKKKFVAATIAAVGSAACLIAYFATSGGRRFMIAFFLALVYAGMEYCGALSKNRNLDEWKRCADERDIFIAMKTSRTTLLILNRLILSGCIISILFYAIFRCPSCLAVIITLCIVSVALFLILLLTNIYYETHN